MKKFEQFRDLKIRKHNEETIRIPVHNFPDTHTGSNMGWPIGFDNTHHFQFFCPNCGGVAKVTHILLAKNMWVMHFRMICEKCEISGQRKIYFNGDCGDYCKQSLDLGNGLNDIVTAIDEMNNDIVGAIMEGK